VITADVNKPKLYPAAVTRLYNRLPSILNHESGRETSPMSEADTALSEGPELETIEQLVERLESDPTPRDEYEFEGPINALGQAIQERGGQSSAGLIAEGVAFLLHAHDRQDPSTWGLYFGPFMSSVTSSGETVDVPSLEMVTDVLLAYWRRRAVESRHPVMKARYADLLWELPKRLNTKPDVNMARIAIDSYLNAVREHRYKTPGIATAKASRALDIALSINDQERVDHAKDLMLTLEEEVGRDDQSGLWGICFDTFVEPPNKRIALTDVQRDKLVADLEGRLSRFAAQPGGHYHPAAAESAAVRLANYYRRRGLRDQATRVLREYGEIVLRMQDNAAALVLTHSLEKLYELYRAFDLHEDADALNDPLRKAGEDTVKELKEVSATAEIPREEAEAYFTVMLAGTPTQVLVRIAMHYVTRRAELEIELREVAQKAPLVYLVSHSIKDDDGRTVAKIGPLTSDPEGHLVRHISQHLWLSTIWLRETMRRAIEGGITLETLVGFLFGCPLFQVKRRRLFEEGLSAYVRGETLVAIHVLVPQVEQVVRQLATAVGAPIYIARRGGGLHTRTLDDLLRDPAVANALTDDVALYLRVLLTDARGWNVRNVVCHGLAPVTAFTQYVADRIVHSLLVLALIRAVGPQGQEDESDSELRG
jgi:Domain of unknown function (DUF4209)